LEFGKTLKIEIKIRVFIKGSLESSKFALESGVSCIMSLKLVDLLKLIGNIKC
jgi:hypothetical protein